MKNVLFPTDFTQQSLASLEQFVKCATGAKFNVLLFAAFELPSSEQETIGSSNKPHLLVMNESYRKGCKKLKEKYAEKVGNIHFKYMYGSSRQVFRNYLEFNEVDQIFFPEGVQFQQPHERFVQPGALVNSSQLPVIKNLTPVPQAKSIQVASFEPELSAASY